MRAPVRCNERGPASPHRQSHLIDPFVKRSTAGVLVELVLETDPIWANAIKQRRERNGLTNAVPPMQTVRCSLPRLFCLMQSAIFSWPKSS